jgi:phosphoribosyl 1,2-cyclic phosphodiesterase
LVIVKICVLASGSSGNATLFSTGRTRVLVDAGLSMRETARRLEAAGETLDSIDAILVTHEHSDHVAGLARLARRLKKPVYLTRLTAPVIDWGAVPPAIEPFQAGAAFTIGDIEVSSFTIPHDAIDPVGFSLRSQGIKFSIATDFGYVTESIRYHLRGSHLMLLESNHDLDMLKVGPYPWPVKQRVMSRVGHLSNHHACEFIENDIDPSTGCLILGHLSEHNNHPEIVRMMAMQSLERRGIAPRLVIAEQKKPTETFLF